MKKLALAAATLALTVGSAIAADLPSRKAAPILPPPPPPPPMWTGFYAGLNAGYNFDANGDVGSQNWAVPVDGTSFGTIVGAGPASMSGSSSHGQNGFIGGAQIGYNYQWSEKFVIGIETDIQGTGVRGSSRVGNAARVHNTGANPLDSEAVGSTTVNAGLDFLGTVRGRIGYLFMPTLLVYGTGGFAYGGAYAEVNQAAYDTRSVPRQGALGTITWMGGGQGNDILTGWTAGGGLEWMIMPNWSLKAEALYWNLGRMSVQTASVTPALGLAEGGYGSTSVSYAGIAARAGVNYHFNWGGSAPIVAKY